MTKVKYDVSDVGDPEESPHAPVGLYRGEVVACEAKTSKQGNAMLETRFKLTHDATGKKLKETYMPVWYYPILDHDNEFVQQRLKEFLLAMGLRPKGTLDTDAIVGKSVQLKLGSDTDQDGDYRPTVKKVMKLASSDEAEEPEGEEEEGEEPEDDDEEAVDLGELDRAALKKFIKEQELGIRVMKAMTDDDIRNAIVEAIGGDEEEDEPEDEPEAEEPEGDGDGYDEMSVADLKAELSERELPTNGGKPALIARLRKDDGDEPF